MIERVQLTERTLSLRDKAPWRKDAGYWGAANRERLHAAAFTASDASLPYMVRMAHAFAGMLAGLDIQILDEDLIAGHFAEKREPDDHAARPPGMNGCDTFAKDIRPRFAYTPEVQAQLDALAQAGAPAAGGCGPYGHSNLNYAAVLQRGLEALAAETDTAAAAHGDPDRRAASTAMAIALRGAIAFAQRHADHLEKLAQAAPPQRAAELRRMAESLRRVPANPAESFFDALQSAWFAYMVGSMSEWASSNSWGCVDRYLLPYYRADISAGRLTQPQAAELIAHFLIKAGTCGEGQSLTLGGSREPNELTELFLRVVEVVRLAEPVISYRVHRATSEDELDAAVAISATGTGQPSFYGDETLQAMFDTRGVRAQDRGRLSLNSCMGVIVSGAEISDMWASITMMPVALELAISRGRRDGKTVEPFASMCPPRYESFEQLLAAYDAIVAHMVAVAARKYRQELAYFARWMPNPFMSALLDDCRTRGLDRFAGGPRYHTAIMEAFGWANVGDSLVAIEELVFGRGEVDLDTLWRAAADDYASHAPLLAKILDCPKYGNGDEQADAMSARVLSAFADSVMSQRHADASPLSGRNWEGYIEFLPSLHTLQSHIHAGKGNVATLDGRRRGQALNKQLGPSVWAVRKGPTAVLSSAARMPIARLTGGQALDISVPHAMVAAEGRQKFKALVRAFLAMGGSHLQVNTASPAELRAAQKDPSQYGHIAVRVGGYSTYFNWLSREAQDDMIARIEAGV